MKRVFALWAVLEAAGCTYDPATQPTEAAIATATETATDTEINWMWVGSCDPARSPDCSVVCSNDSGLVVLAGSCTEGSCRVPDRDGVCAVTDCYVPDGYAACSDPYKRIKDSESGLGFCCKPYGK